MGEYFVTAINCMDGRVQIPVIEFLKSNYQADHVDMITDPGPGKILSDNTDKGAIDSIRKRVEVSVLKHGARVIAVVGHYDCVGDPAGETEQKQHLVDAVALVNKWGLPVTDVIALWANDRFEISRVVQG